MKEKILVVDDDADVLDTLKFALTMEDYEVLTATNGQDALKVLQSAVIDLVVTDIKMPVMNGMELMRHIRDFDNEIEIIALTGHATVEIAVEALKNGGAFDFLRKPMEDVNQLFLTIEKALERRRLRRENKRIDIALKASERFNQAIIDSLPFNILVLDKSGVILKANRTWHDFVKEQSVPAGIGSSFWETCGSRIDDKEVISGIRSVLNGEAHRFEKEFLCKQSCPEKWFLLQACCLENGAEQTVISQVDITRIKELETHLIHGHKMQSVATLAGGIAHQFNNALSGITGAVELLKMSVSDTDAQKWLSVMESSSETMIRLTRQLLSFSQQGRYESKILSLNETIRDTLPLLQNILTSRVNIISDLSDDLRNIKADPSQLQMVLYELIVNSIEAIKDSGTIRIESRNTVGANRNTVGANRNTVGANNDSPLHAAGNYVSLTVKDDGSGIEQTIKDRIFEPFFTTKFQGRGLGLAAVYGIIRNHNGQISVDSEPGKGTEVRIVLPAVDDAPKQKHISEHQEKKTGKTILIIEDNKMNMLLAEKIFGKLGFHVLKAEDGTKAIEIVKKYQDTIDLIYLDMILPDMGGEAIYPIIVHERPAVKIIVCSGYSLQEAAEKIGVTESDSLEYIPKPTTPSLFKEKLKKWFVMGNE